MSGAIAWADAVQAVALFAYDPLGLAGISVRAGAGPVRDHFLMRLRAALPQSMRMHRLPANTADDRLIGCLDLAATLKAGRPVAQKGLLAEADGGVVIIAMAERLPAEGAARLRAALDEGVIALQRDGLSRVLPARFAVIALDEGADPDQRPPDSLLDRLAFHVDLTQVSLRDVNTHQAASFTAADPGDSAAIDAAEILCQAAMALGVNSPRVPLFAVRAARVAAAIHGHGQVTDVDICLAARLVLAPRATQIPAAGQAEPPADEPPGSEPPGSEQPANDQPANDRPASTQPQNAADDEGSGPPPCEPSASQAMADVVLNAVTTALPPDLLARLAQPDAGRGLVRSSGRAGQVKMGTSRGRPAGARQGDPKGGARLHLLETLKAAAPWQALRRGASDRLQIRRDDFRIVRFHQRIGTTTVFAVDASGSSAMNRLSEAKGAVELLLADCYVRRDQVALLAFRGQGATLLLPPTGSLVRAKRSLAGLPAGGPTPLAAGIEAAVNLAGTIRRAGRTPIITLLTDARANVARDGTSGRPRAEAEAVETARLVRASGVAMLLVDTSPRPNPFARRLADEMRAQYLALPYADSEALSRAVRSTARPA